jgi:hypothetical protein
MKYSPKFILYFATLAHLDEEKVKAFNSEFKKKVVKRNDSFFNIYNKYVDVDTFNLNPKRREDILIYNYLKYEVKDKKLIKKGLIAKYEKLVVIPFLEKNPEYLKELFSEGVYYLMNT